MRIIIFFSIYLFVQSYFYFSSKNLFQLKASSKTLYFWIYLFYATSLFLLMFFQDKLSIQIKTIVFNVFFLVTFSQLIACLFFLIEDVRWLLEWIFKKSIVYPLSKIPSSSSHPPISRLLFIKWIGMGIGTSFAGLFIYGFSNRYNYQLHTKKITFQNLPPALKGLRIIQISDIHSGSFSNPQAVQKGIEKIMQQHPHLILFTGDLVNNIASEIEPYKSIFSQLKAPLGVYSILGNHDYGDYVPWQTPEKKKQNLDKLKQHHYEMGWTLLNNDNRILSFQNTSFALIGVENWSAKGFVKHGDIQKAKQGTEQQPFKILMSHDPSHWEAQILKDHADINLTLSGHTHGMQFGVETPWLKWSPVQYLYKQWAGLYQHQHQFLYVNRGFGFLGYQGRVGILPEITLIELA